MQYAKPRVPLFRHSEVTVGAISQIPSLYRPFINLSFAVFPHVLRKQTTDKSTIKCSVDRRIDRKNNSCSCLDDGSVLGAKPSSYLKIRSNKNKSQHLYVQQIVASFYRWLFYSFFFFLSALRLCCTSNILVITRSSYYIYHKLYILYIIIYDKY